MPIQHAVLALLDGSPRHGYGLKADFDAAVGPSWGGLNIGNLNKLLAQMARDGLIISKPVPQRGADRLVHRITAAGRRELDDWLQKSTARPAGYRDDFILKLLAASRRGPDDMRDACQVEREARMADLAALRELRRTATGHPVTVIALEIAIIHAQADLKAIDLAEEHAEDPLPIRPDAELAGSEEMPADVDAGKASGRQAGLSTRLFAELSPAPVIDNALTCA